MKIAFYKAAEGSLLDKAVDIWTGLYGYSHCELVFDQVYHGWSFSASPREGEVRFKKIDFENSDKWVLVDLPHTYEEELDIYESAKKYQRKKYDYKGIFLWFVLPIQKQSSNKWWCSEICPFLLNINPYRISPNKFARIFDLPRQPFEFKFVWRKTY